MSSIKYLNVNDFFVDNGTKGYVLCCKETKDISLVLFYSNSCSHCNDFIPVFKQASIENQNCTFCLINVSNNIQVIEMSNLTIAPIKYVPYVIIYINQRPYMRYDGPTNIQALNMFLQKIISQMPVKQNFIRGGSSGNNNNNNNNNNMNQNFTSHNVQMEQKENEYPDDVDTSVGIPYNLECDGQKCYLKMDTPSNN